MSYLPSNSQAEKIGELKHLLALYETGISRQQELLDKIRKGKYRTTQVTSQVLRALVLGDLNLMKARKKEFEKDLQTLEASQSGSSKGSPVEEDSS